MVENYFKLRGKASKKAIRASKPFGTQGTLRHWIAWYTKTFGRPKNI